MGLMALGTATGGLRRIDYQCMIRALRDTLMTYGRCPSIPEGIIFPQKGGSRWRTATEK